MSMNSSHRILRVLLGIVMLSLIIPLSAPASMAKAKMCCKNKCSHMLRSAAQSQPKPINHCDHKKSPVNCCQENCSKIIGNDISDRLSGLKSRVNLESSQPTHSLFTLTGNIEVPTSENRLKFKSESVFYPTSSPPLFVLHSSYLI